MSINAKNGMTAVGAYSTGANAISANAQTDVLAQIDKLIALFPDPTAASPRPGHPDLNHLHPVAVGRLLTELAALKVAIDATATS